MRIPHTIPPIVLKAYARKLTPEDLAKSYEGRVLRSEDTTWDEKAQPSLRDICLVKISEDYVFYTKLVEEVNRLTLEDHEKRKEEWEKAYAEFVTKKASFERRAAEQIALYGGRLLIGDNPDDADDDDDDEEKKRKDDEPPEIVEDEFAEFEPIKPVLDQLWDDDRVEMIEELDIDYIPFELAVRTIPDDYYWKRCANDKWDYIVDADDHEKQWRRLFFERTVWEAIEAYHPIDGDLYLLLELIEQVAPEIIWIKLDNLIPNCFGTPRKPVEDKTPEADFLPAGPEEDEGFGDEDDLDQRKLKKEKEDAKKEAERQKILEEHRELVKIKLAPPPSEEDEEEGEDEEEEEGEPEEPQEPPEPDRTSSDHLDFGIILPRFPNLKVLSLVFEMQDMGLDYEPRFFILTDNDCLCLAKALAETPSIETFELLRSHLSDEQCKTLVREGLTKMPHLKKINLNYNRIKDKGARAIARLLSDENYRAIHTVHTVNLARNWIHNRGGKALAWVLTKNRHLSHMDLRCNRMGDPAGRDFGHALVKNKNLLALLLGSNRFTEKTAYVFHKMLHYNNSLKELDISSNDFGKKGGDKIGFALRQNRTILKLDTRLCNVGTDVAYYIGTRLRKNRKRISDKYSLVERDDIYPNEVESGLLEEPEELESPEWSDEEEDEEEDEDEDEDEDDDDDYEDEDEDEEEEEQQERAVEVVKAPTDLDMSKTEISVPTA